MNLPNAQTQQFIREHREEDVRRLALQFSGKTDIDLTFALQQIAGWQTARTKLPLWAATDGIIFPPHLAMEQCSSQEAGWYKQRICLYWGREDFLKRREESGERRDLTPTLPQGNGDPNLKLGWWREERGERFLKRREERGGRREVTSDSCEGVGNEEYLNNNCDSKNNVCEKEEIDKSCERKVRSNQMYSLSSLPSPLSTKEPSLPSPPSSLIDLTGGFGVDFSFLARAFQHAVYVERQEELCEIARHNLPLLGVKADVVCADAVEMLMKSRDIDLIFVDPARRDAAGGRTYDLRDCTPDVTLLMPEMLKRARRVMLKLSPMLDYHKAIDDINASAGMHKNVVETVHIVAVDNECKELLLIVSGENHDAPQLFCVNNGEVVEICDAERDVLLIDDMPIGGQYLYEPNAAIMKSGAFGWLSAKYDVRAIAQNSHLFVSDDYRNDFPGRRFRIEKVCTMNKKELRRALDGIKKANVSVRNFPLTAEQLRRKLNVSDGGTTYIFGTTHTNGTHLLLICTKEE